MCGIFGQFRWEGALHSVETLAALTNSLAHRGPDGGAFWEDGTFFFGHRRLAIIDLDRGIQPMATPDKKLVVTFNGEIYNYVELRRTLADRGYAFATQSDTEVLLHGYREWGTRLPEHLIGMFAFGIADREHKTLFLARDPFGEKPLFVTEAKGAVTFSSELRALAGLPGLDHRVDEDALAGYLCLNYVPGNQTLFRGIRRLHPGTWRQYSADGSVRDGVYWSRKVIQECEPAGAAESAIHTLQERIDNAVLLALRSDVPVGVFLSGGIDSSLIAESAVRQGFNGRAFCLDFNEASFSEFDQANLVSKRLGLPLMRVELTSKVLFDFVDVIAHADDPLADSSALAVWALARDASAHNKVVISGDGGDELFAGYLTYQATLLHKATFCRLPMRFRRAVARASNWIPTQEGKVSFSYQVMRFLRAADLPAGEAHYTWNGTWLPGDAASLLTNDKARAAALEFLPWMAGAHHLGNDPSLSDLQWADIGDYLPNDILAKVDRMSMAHGLEVRAPFLNPSLARFALSLPDHLKLRAFGKPKRILRSLAERTFGPQISAAKKKGFSIPIHAWLRGPARELVEDLLSAQSLRRVGCLNVERATQAKRDHFDRRRSLGYELWGLMVFVAWHRARIEASSKLPRSALARLDLGEAA